MPTLVRTNYEHSDSSLESSLDESTRLDVTTDTTSNNNLNHIEQTKWEGGDPVEEGNNDTTIMETSLNLLEGDSFQSSDSSSCSSGSSSESESVSASTNKRKSIKSDQEDKIQSESKSSSFHKSQHMKHEEKASTEYLNRMGSVSSLQSQSRSHRSAASRSQSECHHRSPNNTTGREQTQTLHKSRSRCEDSHSQTRHMINDTTILSESTCSISPKKKASVLQETSGQARTASSQKEPAHIASFQSKTKELPPRQPLQLQWKKQEECDVFLTKFSKMVADFERRNRAKLTDYSSLSPDDQRKEQEMVISILDRLGIRGATLHEKSRSGSMRDVLDESTMVAQDDPSVTRMDDTVTSFVVGDEPMVNASARVNKVVVLGMKKDRKESQSAHIGKVGPKDLSSELLSPIPGDKSSPKHLKLNGMSVRFTAPSPPSTHGGSPVSFGGCGNDDDSSQDSIEIARFADNSASSQSSLYKSPALERIHRSNASKRLASTSGKRGQDMCRKKLNDSSSSESDMIRNEIMASPSGQQWNSSNDSLSFVSGDEQGKQHPFTASQSPISESARRHGSRKERSQSRYHEKSQRDRYRFDQSIDSVEMSLIHDQRQRLREIPANIGLKDGVPFHYNKLHVKRSKRPARQERTARGRSRNVAVDFSDPLGVYSGDEGDDLYQIFEWMYSQDQNAVSKGSKASHSDSKGIFFSLSQDQIINVAVKLLLEAEAEASNSGRSQYSDDSSLVGQTLILVRDKDDITTWERALREHTPFSVLNHTSLPLRDRKRVSTASRCATFDVVISTFDAAKAPDVTTQIDDDGCAVSRHGAESQSDGWMVKRSASSHSQSQNIAPAVQCKQLSVLHRISWRRVIFIDNLGRKCFLAKLGTSRAFAAKALNGRSR